MNKKFIAGVSCLLLSAGMSAAALADMNSDRYRANAQFAIADVDDLEDAGSAIVLTGIKPMSKVHRNFAVEGEFTTTAGKPGESFNGGVVFGDIDVEASYYTLGAYASWNHPINQTVTLKGRAGILYENVEVEMKSSVLGNAKEDDTDTGLSYGIGAYFNVTKDINIVTEYTQIESDVSHLGAGVQWLF